MQRRAFFLGFAATPLPRPGKPVVACRELVTAPRTWYVDGTNGSDSNDGSTSLLAFKTIQHAVSTVAAGFDFATTGTIQVAAGSYLEAVVIPRFVGQTPAVTIVGNPAVNSDVVVQPSSGTPFTAVDGGSVILDSMCVISLTGYGIISDAQSHLLLRNINFGYCANAHMFAEHGGFLEMLAGNYTISGGALWHVAAGARGHFLHQGCYVTYVNNPNFTSFALGALGSFIDCRLLLGWAGAYTAATMHGVNNDGTALMVPPNVGYWP